MAETIAQAKQKALPPLACLAHLLDRLKWKTQLIPQTWQTHNSHKANPPGRWKIGLLGWFWLRLSYLSYTRFFKISSLMLFINLKSDSVFISKKSSWSLAKYASLIMSCSKKSSKSGYFSKIDPLPIFSLLLMTLKNFISLYSTLSSALIYEP